MHKPKGFDEFFRLQKEQCSCFGPSHLEDEHFLAKHKTGNTSAIHHTSYGHHNQSKIDEPIIKTSCKRSLRRMPHPQTAPSSSATNLRSQGETSRFPLEVTPTKIKQEQEINPKPFNEMMDMHKPHLNHHEITTQPHYEPKDFHQFQYQLYPSYVCHAPPHHHQQNPHLKITFGASTSNKTFTCTPQTASSNKIQAKINEEIMHDSSKVLPFLSVVQKNNQIPRELLKSQSLQHLSNQNYHDATSLDIEHSIKQQAFQTPKKEDKKLEMKMTPQNFKKISSNMECSKNFLLKKMDDVQEICSQPGSDEGDSSSDESIVVGRLNEYCSMLEHKGASTITAEKSIQSRTAGPSISSTISHYHFNRKKDEL